MLEEFKKNKVFFKEAGNEELNLVFELRKKIFCEEFGYIKPGQESDVYDEIAHNYLAFSGNMAIGTLRVIDDKDLNKLEGKNGIIKKDGRVRFPMEKEVDLMDYRKPERKIIEYSRLVVSPDYRNKGITLGLFACGYKYAKENGITDGFTIANCEINSRGKNLPEDKKIEIPKIFTKIGFFSISDPFEYKEFNAYAVPMRISKESLNKSYEKIFEELIKDKEIILF